MLFVGIDLTDPYAGRRRDVDVAVLDPSTSEIRFPRPLAWRDSGVPGMASEVTERFEPGAHALVLDAPQALARAGSSVRDCERLCQAPGRTPDVLPTAGSRPFAGFVRGGVELWTGLLASGRWRVGAAAPSPGDLYEAFPGDAWRRLAGRGVLERKSTPTGREQRATLLQQLGFRLLVDGLPNDDQLDAAICAVLGAWAQTDSPVPIDLVGAPAWTDPSGVLREGQILSPTARVPLPHPLAHSAPSDAPVKARTRSNPSHTIEAGRRPQQILRAGETWVYRATAAGVGPAETTRLLEEHQVLWRPVRNAAGAAIANLKWLRPGDPIVVVYSGIGDRWLSRLRAPSPSAALHPIDGFASCVAAVAPESALERDLEVAGYVRRAHQHTHEVLVLEPPRRLPSTAPALTLPAGRNAIGRSPMPAPDVTS